MATPSATEPPGAPVTVAILAKAPVAGLAKTRLIPQLGADGAARLARWMLARSVATALAARLGPVTLWCAPDCAHPAFAAYAADTRLSLQPQPEGDLGVRMFAAARAANTPAGVLIIGSDCPQLDAHSLRTAAFALAEHDASVIPAEDGGYVLIALRRAEPAVFSDLPWSTAEVMARTRARFAALGWRVAEAASHWDVDEPADVERLAALHPEVRAVVLGQGAQS